MPDNLTSDPSETKQKDPLAAIVSSLQTLKEDQLLRLFTSLVEARRGAAHSTEKPVGAGLQASGQPEPATGESTSDSISTLRNPVFSSGHVRPAQVIAQYIARIRFHTRAIIFAPEFWKDILANTFPWVITLLAAPLVVPLAFQMDRAAQRAELSIEYAFLVGYTPSLGNREIELIARVLQHPVYHEYARARALSGQGPGLETIHLHGNGLTPAMRRTLVAETANLVVYLKQSAAELKTQKSLLAGLGPNELRIQAFRLSTADLTSDDSALREAVSREIDNKISKVEELVSLMNHLRASSASTDPEIRLKLTILNKGATDGLVRHEGSVVFRGHTYPLERAAPPAEGPASAAVPVFQTNESASDFAPQSVGKIERDSMADLWYKFSLGKRADVDLKDLCRNGDYIKVVLIDHNDNEVKVSDGQLACREAGEST